MMYSKNGHVCFDGNKDSIEDYYGEQVGTGSLPVFQGAKVQRGHGLGNMLGSLMRTAMPLIKKGSKALGKQVLSTGINIANDLLQGENVKQSLKTRFREAGQNMMSQAADYVRPPGEPVRRGIKRRASLDRDIRRPAKQRRTSKAPRDIFERR